MGEYNASIVDKIFAKNVDEQINHVFDILVESGNLAVQNYKECVDILL